MASRRNLKKDIQYLYSELLTECFTISCLCPNCDAAKTEELAAKIMTNSYEFIQRAGHYDGKNNPQIIKAYYKKLGEDLLQDVLAIGQEMETLTK